ncbi:hypothetical protein WN55_09952 [Dufourea novaeangliae]|uniref:Protein quiver n=1 Tax=Dufourea novaeangliae TaxID=178035 RepID=A0A154P9P8_DUFNO|nr:hypothetical protein WN55_09952 [Dufourea novaeangliae]
MKKLIYCAHNLMEVLDFKFIVPHLLFAERKLFIPNSKVQVTSIITAVERDCAPQKRTVPIYSYVDYKWENKEEIVKTAYEEGCFTGEDRGAPAGPPQYCFCSYHLCNSSESIGKMNMYIFVLLVILLVAKST